MRKFVTVFVTVLIFAAFLLGCKKEPPPPDAGPPPILAPVPIREGKCFTIVDRYLANGWWEGNTFCDYQGWKWTCPSSDDAHRVCHRGDQLPAEK